MWPALWWKSYDHFQFVVYGTSKKLNASCVPLVKKWVNYVPRNVGNSQFQNSSSCSALTRIAHYVDVKLGGYILHTSCTDNSPQSTMISHCSFDFSLIWSAYRQWVTI